VAETKPEKTQRTFALPTESTFPSLHRPCRKCMLQQLCTAENNEPLIIIKNPSDLSQAE